MNLAELPLRAKPDVVKGNGELSGIPIPMKHSRGSSRIIVDKAEVVNSPHQIGLGQVKSIATPVAGRQ